MFCPPAFGEFGTVELLKMKFYYYATAEILLTVVYGMLKVGLPERFELVLL
jgi:hypothetical protein